MRGVSMSSTVLVSLSCVWGLQVPAFPNIGYLGQGYDFMYGNPHTTSVADGSDPGFRSPVFDLSVYKGKLTPDQRYQVPDGTDVIQCASCRSDFKTTDISGSKSYYDSLSVDVKLDVSYMGASFSASTDYKQVHNQTSSYHNVITESYAECCVYIGTLQRYALPPLSTNLKNAVNKMPILYTTNPSYFDGFISSFGTHYLVKVSMGGRFGIRSTVSKNEWSLLSSSNLDVKVAAGYHALASTLAVNTMTDTQKKQASAFQNSTITSQETRFVVGGTFPADGQETTWIRSAKIDPMPLSYELQSIDKLLSADNFPSDGTIAAKKTALNTALTNYCQSLIKKGVISTCVPPSKDPSFPPVSIFGGLYQVDDCSQDSVKNAYTKALSCPKDYSHHRVGRVATPDSGCGGTQYLCLAKNKTVDPIHYFGGMYQVADNSAENIVNPLTGKLTCPSGYSQFHAGRVLAGDTPVGAAQIICLNKQVQLGSTPLAGGFQHGDANIQDNINNMYTGAPSCPSKYKSYPYGRIYAPEGRDGAAQYICISNIF